MRCPGKEACPDRPGKEIPCGAKTAAAPEALPEGLDRLASFRL
jgi:hypothetical protein